MTLQALYIIFVVLAIILIHSGAGRHIEYIQYVLTDDQTLTNERLDFGAHLIYTTALFVCRMSGLWFYRRLSDRHNRLLRSIHIAAVFLIAAFLPQFLMLVVHCTPVTSLWPYP